MSSSKLDELSQSAEHWTLAEDSQLCTLLGNVNECISQKVHEAYSSLKKGNSSTDRLSVNVSNLNNRLASYTNDHFIESRVYDETPVPPQVAESSQVKTVTERQQETVENMRHAVSLGFDLIRNQFKRIEMRPEDFDEDDDPTFVPEPVFEPFDLHLSRLLPYLIGTEDWIISSSAGISEMSSESGKVNEDVVIGLPAFVQPRILNIINNSSAIKEAPVAVSSCFGSSAIEEPPTNKQTNIGSDASAKSDHSGLFADDSSDRESSSSDDLFHSASVQPIARMPVVTALSDPSKSSQVEADFSHAVSAIHSIPDITNPPLPGTVTAGTVISEKNSGLVRVNIASDKSVVSNMKDSIFDDSESDEEFFAEPTPPKRGQILTTKEPQVVKDMQRNFDGDHIAITTEQKELPTGNEVDKLKEEVLHSEPSVIKVDSDSVISAHKGSSLLENDSMKYSSAVPSGDKQRSSKTFSKNLFDDSSDDDLFTEFKVRGSAPSTENMAQPNQSLSGKAVFRAGGRISADFANRLSGLIVAPPKVISSTSAEVEPPNFTRKPSVSSGSSSAHAPDEANNYPRMRMPANPHADEFKSRLSAILVAKPATLDAETNRISKESLDGGGGALLSSVLKSRTKGPPRRAPTRGKRDSDINKVKVAECLPPGLSDSSSNSAEQMSASGKSPSEFKTEIKQDQNNTVLLSSKDLPVDGCVKFRDPATAISTVTATSRDTRSSLLTRSFVPPAGPEKTVTKGHIAKSFVAPADSSESESLESVSALGIEPAKRHTICHGNPEWESVSKDSAKVVNPHVNASHDSLGTKSTEVTSVKGINASKASVVPAFISEFGPSEKVPAKEIAAVKPVAEIYDPSEWEAIDVVSAKGYVEPYQIYVRKEKVPEKNPEPVEEVLVKTAMANRQAPVLFPDSDDDDIFAGMSSKSVKTQSITLPAKVDVGSSQLVLSQKNSKRMNSESHISKTDTNNIFASDVEEDSVFAFHTKPSVNSTSDKTVQNSYTIPSKVAKGKSCGLFDDDSDSDTNLFK